MLVVTYNHARFVRQALDSALAQRLPQPFEVLVSEDCSTDGTREIVQEYAKRHPHLVRLLLSERNLHSNEVVARGVRAARGRYVAVLDGDDYWTSDDKLGAQVAFLDVRPDVTICFHNVQVVDEHSQTTGRLWNAPGQPEVSGLHELLRGNFIATSSVVYRRAAVPRSRPGTTASFRSRTGRCTSSTPVRAESAISTARSAHTACTAAGLFSTLGEREKLEANADFYRRLRAFSPRPLAAEVARGQRDYFFGWAEEFRRRGDRRMLLRCLRWAWDGRLSAARPDRRVLPLPAGAPGEPRAGPTDRRRASARAGR